MGRARLITPMDPLTARQLFDSLSERLSLRWTAGAHGNGPGRGFSPQNAMKLYFCVRVSSSAKSSQ